MSLQLAQRIAVTIAALLVYRLGLHIPLPGVDLSSGFGQTLMFSDGAVARLSLFSLSLLPYITAAFALQLLGMVSPALKALRNDGEHGRRRIELYTRCGAVLLAALQAYAVAIGLERAPLIVPEPGLLFRLTAVLTLTGGVVFLIWLSEQITVRGVGNGIALILFAGIAPQFPQTVVATLALGRMGAISPHEQLALALIVVASTVLAVVMERARRRLPVRFSAQTADLALKLNLAGFVPIFLASWLLLIPTTVAVFAGATRSGWGVAALSAFARGQPLFYVAYALVTVFVTYLYTALVYDPERMAERLTRYGGFAADVADGETTADHLDRVISRTTALGAAYLVVMALLTELLIPRLAGMLYFGGLWVMISVCVTLDIEAQVRTHLAQPRES